MFKFLFIPLFFLINISCFAQGAYKAVILNELSQDILLLKNSCIKAPLSQNNQPPSELNQLLSSIAKKCNDKKTELTSLKFKIENTPAEDLDDFVLDTLLRPQRYRGKYPIPIPYLNTASNTLFTKIRQNYNDMPYASRIAVLKAVISKKDKTLLPIAIMGLKSSDNRESLYAQDALLAIDKDKATKYIIKAIKKERGSAYIKASIKKLSRLDKGLAAQLFFKYVKEKILPIRSISEIIEYPFTDWSQAFGKYADILIENLNEDASTQINLTDIKDLDAFLVVFKNTESNAIIKELWHYIDGEKLSKIVDAASSIDLKLSYEEAIANAFNRILHNKALYTKYPHIFKQSAKAQDILRGLIRKQVYFQTGTNKWDIKQTLSQSDIDKIYEMNFALIENMFQGIIFANKGRFYNRRISAMLICDINTKEGFFNIAPVFSTIFACAYDISQFKSDIWKQGECRALIERMFERLTNQDMLSLLNKINSEYKPLIEVIFKYNISQKDPEYEFDISQTNLVLQFIFNKNPYNVFIFPIKINKNTYITSENVSFSLTPTIDTKNWQIIYNVKYSAKNAKAEEIKAPFYTSVSLKEMPVEILNKGIVRITKDMRGK